VGGETKFACVDGPEFDGLQVDFDELLRRAERYKKYEQMALREFKSKLEKGEVHRCKPELDM